MPATGRSQAKPGRPRRSAPGRPLAVVVETLGPPISSVAWSPQVVAQTLEILPIARRRDELVWFKPLHADSLRVGLPLSAKPGEVVVDVMSWYPLQPRVVHSTSWRLEDGRVILTYAAVVEPPGALPRDSLVELPIARAELARGDAMGPPKAIGVAAVLEHALRHLCWLVHDDPAIAEALSGWTAALAGYKPEPFRALA